MSHYFAIAIDGPAASGKSTIAKKLASFLGITMINTGEMYRALAWATLHYGVDFNHLEAVSHLLSSINMECSSANNLSTVRIDGHDLQGNMLRTQSINERVSSIAAMPQVRDFLLIKQRNYLQTTSVVMEGRDIGTVVFPQTPYKIYIDASLEVRNARRKAEGVLDSVGERDAQDASRRLAPLSIASDATRIDSSHMQLDEVFNACLTILEKKGLRLPSR